ncbi:hypothetical protein PAXINDRAFT_98216 [Paxillus involutus ATCC 200175]|nr:hypothetical protein PAXINDRAFT_98216 [Paxillus involutus ATCC 200175]
MTSVSISWALIGRPVGLLPALVKFNVILPPENNPYQGLSDLRWNRCSLSPIKPSCRSKINPQIFASGIASRDDLGPGCVLNGHDGSWLASGQDAILTDKEDTVGRLMPDMLASIFTAHGLHLQAFVESVGCFSSLLIRVYELKHRRTEACQAAAGSVPIDIHLDSRKLLSGILRGFLETWDYQASATFRPESSSLWNALGDRDPAKNGTPDRDQTQVHIYTTCSLNDGDLEEVFEEGLDDDKPDGDESQDRSTFAQQYMQFVSEAQVAPPAASLATCPVGLCLWRDPKVQASGVCGVRISCRDISKHFGAVHGIKKMTWSQPMVCSWDGCRLGAKTIIRKFFVRHIRECHLNHPRQGPH